MCVCVCHGGEVCGAESSSYQWRRCCLSFAACLLDISAARCSFAIEDDKRHTNDEEVEDVANANTPVDVITFAWKCSHMKS